MNIVSADVKGEPGTGYENSESKGPFECANCHYFRPGESSCGQKVMIQRSKQPKIGDRVKVDQRGCCEYVDRIGSKGGKLTEAARSRNG